MRFVTLVTLLFVAVPAYGQDNDAERLYRAMEKEVRSAKTLHFAFDGQINMMGMQGTMKGEAWLAEGQKGNISLEGEFPGDKMKLTRISDGKSTYSKMNEKVDVTAHKPEEQHTEQVLGMVARVGMTVGFMTSRKRTPDDKEPFDLDKMAAIKDFKLGAKEKIGKHNTQAVDYQVTMPDGITAKATVWIDTETKLPVKREIGVQKGGVEEARITETYSTFTVDGKIDAKLFELPK
jgi:outer membrane lipoprotein-sorting protein